MTPTRPAIRATVLAAVAAAASTSADAGLPAPLALAGPGPYYTLQVPPALQAAATRPDLGDLRVRNARGEPMAFAWAPASAGNAQPEEADATIYAVPVPPPPRTTAGAPPEPAPPSWIVDTQAPGFSLERLVLALAPASQGVFHLRVEASDDLQRDWRLVDPAAQVVQLAAPAGASASAPLQATTIELASTVARYLRLTGADAPSDPAPVLDGARVVRSLRHAVEAPIGWSAPIAPASCGERHCDYVLPRSLRVEALQVELADVDTIAELTVSGRLDATAAPSPRPHLLRSLHEPLHALRDLHEKTGPQPDAARWQALAEGEAWWLSRAGAQHDLRSPPLRLDGNAWPMLRVETTQPIARLGHAPPTLRLGTRPATLVFLAHGPGPFSLGLAPAGEPSPGMTLAALLPARGAGDPLPADTATIPPEALVAAPAAAPASSIVPAPAPPRRDGPWLWAALLAGVAAMGAMAWSLLRRPVGRDG